MQKEKTEITVLKNFHGFIDEAEVVETVKRFTVKRYTRQYDFYRKVYYYSKLKPLHEVSYKSKKYFAFYLPELGLCISLK